MIQPSIFDDLGPALRDQGQASVLDHAGADWRARAMDAMEALAAEGAPFTSEDLRARIGEPSHPNA